MPDPKKVINDIIKDIGEPNFLEEDDDDYDYDPEDIADIEDEEDELY